MEINIGDTNYSMGVLVSDLERVNNLNKGDVLYYRNELGEYIPIIEMYRAEIDQMIKKVMSRQKMKYTIHFSGNIKKESKLSRFSMQLLGHMIEKMGFRNSTGRKSITDFMDDTGMTRFAVTSAMKQLLKDDFIRRKPVKNTWIYMVNPSMYMKASFNQIYLMVGEYMSMKYDYKVDDLATRKYGSKGGYKFIDGKLKPTTDED